MAKRANTKKDEKKQVNTEPPLTAKPQEGAQIIKLHGYITDEMKVVKKEALVLIIGNGEEELSIEVADKISISRHTSKGYPDKWAFTYKQLVETLNTVPKIDEEESISSALIKNKKTKSKK